jgi:tetratricopeptide (TPR) repeat protein
MSSYSRLVIFTILIFSTIGCANNNLISKQEEDLNIILALDSEKEKDYLKSFQYYNKLYISTKKQTYLSKAIGYAYKANKFENMYHLSKEGTNKFPKEREYFTQQMVVALMAQKKYNKALSDAKRLLKEFPNDKSYELVANIYYAKKDYINSSKYYESAYAQNQNEKTLIKLTTILYSYLDKKDVALAYLETALQTKGCSSAVCDRLMLIYQEQKNVNGMLSILHKMYDKYKRNPALKRTTLIIQNLIVSLLEQTDIKKAITFLEETKIDDAKLMSLYYADGQSKKALKKTIKLYRKTKRPELLGKIAMYRFEMAKNKKKVMRNVIANFELALKRGVKDASYYNYYGYLLIDFNINVKKGLELVKEALKIAPNNIAYLDSLAWGYHKSGECKKAYKIMSKVIKQIGTKDKEIKTHWDKINRCNKGKK